MRIFSRPQYESEFTRFLNELKQRDPDVQKAQHAGMARLWDKPPIDQDERRRAAASAVKRLPYVYE
ncbi:MAG: DUF3460 family protein [Oxalobacter sp.]|nr:MAG: DUF3460 family protein [Oxalobacter sp.]